ncbi:Catechol 1,2-dioxygenase [Caballeronia sordidicola]|uniref:Catechol 1,2-dioxygenase n=1 Tax=Caballeronia sordidicola TaxID=196367 RepID=A0A242M9E5_CABSO|nr:Catechol 1,2-dioxygenase [Caballeronia sordidicola]
MGKNRPFATRFKKKRDGLPKLRFFCFKSNFQT